MNTSSSSDHSVRGAKWFGGTLLPRPLAGLLVVHLGLLGFSAWWHSPTQDEAAHLAAGLAIWRFGHFDLYRVNPPLVKAVAAIPVLLADHRENWSHYAVDGARRSEWDAGSDLIVANGERSLWLITLARWACLPFSLLGLVVCWRWGNELSGPAGAFISAALWCFSPNVIGHGALITPDIPATACGLLAAWRLHLWLQRKTWRNALFAGLALGLALLAKTYWILLVGLWPVVLLLDSGLGRRDSVPTSSILWQFLFLLAVGWNLLNLGYAFQGTGTPLGELPFYSRAFSGELRDPEIDSPGNLFRGQGLGALPLPLPRDYVSGMDLQKRDFEGLHWNYLLGKNRQSGWWYYYLVGLGVKVPLGTWTLVLLGLGAWIALPQARQGFRGLLPLILPAAVLFLVASCQTSLNQHVRYVFPVLPVLYLVAAQAVLLPVRWPAWLGVGLTMTASLSAYPHSLSYFNLLAGGPAGGHGVLIGSNIDWGQDLVHVRRWLREHPECRPATLAWVAGYPASAIGVELPQTPPGPVVPGWHLISVHLLHEARHPYAAYLRLTPVDRVGFSFNIYHVPVNMPSTPEEH